MENNNKSDISDCLSHNYIIQEVLKAREAHVQNLMEAGQKDLLKISQDKKAYNEMLEKLIIQSCFQLLEDKIYVICRECDKATVEV
jgi:vacuolar-type H+-ATPase subunit E/Vma4